MTTQRQNKSWGCFSVPLLSGGIVLLLLLFGLGPMPGGIRSNAQNAAVQTARQVGQILFSYAMDNNGQYPDGKSSTEVFQKLVNADYVTDPNIFYVPLAGKVPPVFGQALKPENISWDITGGVDSASGDGIPLVFLTGYKVTYAAGTPAVPLIKPYPRFGWEGPRQDFLGAWFGWRTIHYWDSPGIAVMYKSNAATFRNFDSTPTPDGAIPNFIPPDFKPDGHTYRQLTPDGVLP